MASKNPFLESPLETVTERIQQERFALPPLPTEEPAADQPYTPPAKAPAQADTRAPSKGRQAGDYAPPAEFRPLFEAAAREFNVPVNVLMALGHQESRFNPKAIGTPTEWGRAKGMMQYLDSTASGLGINPFDPNQAIPAAARQLRERLDKGYSMIDAVREHFAGPNRKLWGQKTTVYGDEVMGKAARIGETLYPFENSPEEVARRDRQRTEIEAQELYRDVKPAGTGTEAGLPAQQDIDNRGFFDRAGDAVSTGYDNMVQSLNTARFAVAGGDSGELANALAAKFQREANRPNTTGEKEIDAAFQDVTNAQGAWDTVKAGAKAVGTAITNPKDLAIGIVEQAPNMLPTLAGGAAGAGAGGAAGAGVGALFGGVGAVPGAVGGATWGGRAGMVAGTTATELGAEVEQMLIERLQANKATPSAGNIKALLDDQAFQAEARERGLKKGLTVALVDQLFLGLGGKVATAPSRQALKTGVAPTVGKRVAAGGAAVGLDATGEVVGEAASQKVARGEVDAGDALREGVYGFGQSIVEPAVGGAMEIAKRGLPGATPSAQPSPTTPAAPASATTPAGAPAAAAEASPTAAANQAAPAPAEAAPVATATPPAPSQADGPLTRAMENTAEQPARVTVTAPEGEITGFVQERTEDAQGNTVTRVLGDDGQVYTFTSDDPVQITPEAGPLAKALEKVAAKAPQLDQTATTGVAANGDLGIRNVGQQGDQAAAQAGANQPAAGAGDQAGPAVVRGDAGASELGAGAGVSGADQTADTQPALSQQQGTAATNSDTLYQQAVDIVRKSGSANPNEVQRHLRIGYNQASQLIQQMERDGIVSPLAGDGTRTVLAQQPEQQAAPELSGNAEQLAAAPANIEAMTEPELRAQLKAVAAQAKETGMTPELKEQRRQIEAQINKLVTADFTAAIDEAPANLDEAEAKAYAELSAAMNAEFGEDVAAELIERAAVMTDGGTAAQFFQALEGLVNERQQQTAESNPAGQEPAAGQPAEGSAGPAKQGQEGQAEAVANEHAGKWFGSKEKAEAFIAKKKAGATHDAVQTGKARWEIKPKAAQPATLTDEGTKQPATGKEPLQVQAAEEVPNLAPAAEQKPAFTGDVQTRAERISQGLRKKRGFSRGESGYTLAMAEQDMADIEAMRQKDGADTEALDDLAKQLTWHMDRMREEDASKPEPTTPTGGKKDQFANNKIFTADKVEAARARLKSKLTQLNAGIDPELLMDGMTIAGAYIEEGVRNFSDYAKAMTEDLGDNIKPYLLSFYEAARNYPGLDTEGMSTVDEAKAAHAELMKTADTTEVQEAIGETVAKPAKRTRKTGSKADMTLTQDWGVDHIDGWEELKGGANEPTDYGLRGGVKDAFLKEASTYLNAVAGILTEQGYTPHTDGKGRPDKPVSVNESGVAGSGDVTLTLDHSETGGGIYVHIGDSSLRGVVPTTQSGIAVMFRAASAADKYGTKGQNRWAPTDLSAANFAIMLDKEAKLYADRKAAAATKEKTQNDTQGTQTGAGVGAEGQAAGAVRRAEGEQPAGRGAESDTRTSRGDDSGSPAAGNRGGDNAGQARVRGRSDGADANAEAAVQGSREPGAAAGRRGSDEPSSGVRNYRIQPGELKREGSWKATAQRNVEIVELAKKITAEGRQATPEERAQLVKYTGWGASEIANGIFPNQYGQYKDASWRELGERLKGALTEEEYAQARRTTQYAHYTSEGVIRSIYTGLQRLGVAGGSIIEPGMGIGHFNGLMPDGMAANSRYTGIEYDTLTGTIGKLLYPESNIIVGDYTRTNLPKDFFDAAVGNPPFSSTQILTDPEYKSRRPMLHDYFFMKTIDRVKPGGVLVFVTSKGTMDKASDKSRKYLAERANLLGAVRLPQTAFKDNAGTEVVTDVIFLQKRGPGIADNGVQWLGTKDVQTPQGPAAINEYFADHPEMVLGSHALQGSMYRANEYTVLPPAGDIDELFAKAVQSLPENVFRPERGTVAERALVQERDFNPKSRKEGGLYLSDDGKLMQVENGSGVPVEFRTNADGKQIALTPKQKKWLRSYVSLRDALKQAQYDQLNDGNWQKSLKELNKVYDAFVKEHGPILDYTTIERTGPDGTVTETKRYKNDPLLRMDAEGALAYALETVKEDGSIAKGAVLTGRVLEAPRDPEIKTTQDALFVSLNRNGKLLMDDVAALAGTDTESVIRDLGTAIYDAPGAGWQLADEYLSGNVVGKLKESRAAAELDPRYKRNVEALLAVQPRPLGPTDITVRLGANWVPASDIEKFASEVLGERMDVTYSPLLSKWDVDQKSRSLTEWGFDKMSAGQILEGVLNNRQLKITFRDQEGKTHVDLDGTEKANDIAKKMRERFSTWLWTDPKRAERLVSYYNENFNNIAPRKFDGSHLTLPGVSALIQLRPHQKRAVWRVIQQGDSYLAHAVGAGKTMEMIAAGMEERRLGLVNKPMYVVPNHMLAQFSREFMELYPAANIMVADEQNFHTHNRKRFVAQAALNNPDAIIITHSAFGRIGMSDEFYTDFMQRQIDDWKTALEDADSSDRVTVKQIERRIEQLEQRMEGRQNRDTKDQVLTFEELGVDKLYVDEFHEFRKLDFATNQGSVKGVDPNGSQRALDLFMKVEHLRSKKPGRALVAASGTPVTNTMGELYTAQRFFQPEQMKEDGLESFDAWANQYGDIVTGFEQNAAGGYDMVARFAKFQNVPELMRRVRSFMDILTSSNLGELVKRPDVVGGGRKVEVTPSPAGYKEFQQGLQKRIEAIKRRKGPPKKGEDIILNVIGDGRFSAIDMRFVDPTLPSDPDSKLNQMIDDLIAAYNETANWEYAAKDGKVEPLKGSTLMLFTDIGLGEQSAASRGFDMRGWIEKRLTDAGIPREHIAFMRDFKQHAKKERMFADMREGKKRILIGGKEMETGTNVQKRLSHLFHLDAPWFPASVEQREGRAVRQGNQNKQVVLKAYATKGSYDSTMWGMNARKARFIEQAMNGDDSVRSMEDVSEASAFEMAAALASGDERYMKLAGLKADVDRLERLRQAHYDDQNRLMREKHWAEEQIKRNTTRVQELDKAIAKRQPIKAGEFEGKVGSTTYDSREDFSQAMFKEFQDIAGTGLQDEREIGEIGGFPIKFYGLEMKGGTYAASLHVDLPGDPDPLLTFPLDPDVAVTGIATRAANQVNGMDKDRASAQGYIDSAKAKAEQASKRLGAPFPEEALLLDKVAELNSLEAELAAESKQNNADAAAATVEVEGATEQADAAASAEPRYSVNAEGQAVGEFGPVTEDFRDDPAGAIQYLQQQRTGEAIIDHPKLGEISLIWGDGKMGLSHIADRRGEDFLPRIAAILQETDVYEKSNQIGRVFLGNESDEATIRLDWNGQAKAWLVSAYEKYGDAKQSAQPEPANRSEVVRQRSGKLNVDDLRSEITTGVIGQVVARMIDNGQIVLHQNAETMPKAARGKKGVQAVTLANGQIHLVANRLTRDNARPVLLHEMFHMGGEALVGSKEWGNLMGRLGSLHRQAELSSGKAREFFDRASDRVAAARQQGAVSTGMTVEEFGAYAVEEWEQNRDSLPAAIRKWVEDIIGHVKAYVLARYGKQLGTVTPAQLAGMAKLVIMNAAVLAERGQLSGISGKFSVNDESQALDEASAALDAPKVKDDYIGRVLGDMSLGARLLVHPRTVAAVHKEFTPVYRTAISQMETRDKFIAEFGADVKAYDHLDQQGKENVNKVLELGRLTSAVYSADALRDGVANTGEKSTVVMVGGKPFVTKERVQALLTEAGEVVKLNEQEIKAYQDLRRMFDHALDKMRDVTLEEMGFGEFAGQGNAAKKIIATIDDKTPPEKAERIKNIAAFVAEIEQAKRAGYVPLARYGDYVVTVKEKVADVSFVEDDKEHYIAKGLPDSFAPELVEMGAERNAEGWRIKKSQKQDVERLTEKTIYSTKVETGLGDILNERRAGKVDDIKAVKEAIDKARAEWVGKNPNRRIVAFKTREKKTDQPVKLADVDALAEVANIDNGTWDAVRDKLADAIKAKGFRRHFFHSDNVPGYTGDFERSIADYVIGMSGYLSRRQHMKKWENAVSGINEKPKLFEYASKYRNYVNDPQEELAMVKQIGFFTYIAGVLASAFANLTQVPLMTLPTLGQVAPLPLLTKEIGRAYKDAARMISAGVGLDMFDPNKAPADVRDILKEAWAEGSFVPLESFDLMMTARQRNVGARKGVKAFNKATQIIALGFTFAERMNRLVTFIAAARVAQKRAVQENAKRVLAGDALARAEVLRNWNPKSFAEWAVDESQYRMGKANRPSVMRGVGSAIMQFKGFMLQTMEAWYRMAALHGKEGKYAAAASLLALYSLSGLWGLPGADDLRELLESIYKTITGKDLDLKTELRAWIARTSGSNALSQIVTKGASYPLGVDLTRVGMGSIVPDSPLAAAGIPFDILIGRPKRAFEKMSAGDELGALGELSPNFLKHWLVSGSWALDGVRDKQGNLILAPDELGNGDLAMKAIGFQPSIVTDVRDYEYAQRRQETAVDGLKRSYTNKLAKAMVRTETASPEEAQEIEQEIADIYADIDEHNATAAPEEVIKIGARALRNKMMREREGVKGTWGRERKAGREAAEELRGVFGLQAGEEDDE